MTYSQSRHHLPLNNTLFESTANLRAPLPANATLVNLHDAADTSVTALPAPKVVVVVERKASLWARVVAKIKQVFGVKKKEVVPPEEERELEIGIPTDFRHHGTGGKAPLRAPVGDSMKVGVLKEEEGEWVDVQDGKKFAKK